MWNWFNNNLDIWKVQTVHKGTDLRKLCEMNYLHGCTLRQWEEAESKWQVNRRKLLAYQQLHFVCKREQIFQFSLASELNVFRCIIGLLIFFLFFLFILFFISIFYGSCGLIQIKTRWETERYFTFSDPARMYFSNWLVTPVRMDNCKERHVARSGTKFMTMMNSKLYVVTGTQLEVCYAICWRFSIILLFLKTRHSSFHKFLYNLVVGYLCLGVLHFFVYRRKGDYVSTCVCLFVC